MILTVAPPVRHALVVHCPDCNFQKFSAVPGEELPHLCVVKGQLVYRYSDVAVPIDFWLLQSVQKA